VNGRAPVPAAAGRIASALRRWYRAKGRDLPWRRTREAYPILVSEVMLQQTTVRAVIPYYEAFLSRFPDWQSLAGADERDLLAAWAGLGYYSRARNLQSAARRILTEEGGRFPADPRRARLLPGVGDYTAGAVASICFGLPEPALDGNACRVLARLAGVRGDPRRAAVRRRLHDFARSLLDPARSEEARRRTKRADPGEMNQAIMELGATICTPASPRCTACPVERHCQAATGGTTDLIPPPANRPAAVTVHSAAAFAVRGGRVLLARREGREFMGGFWELPGTMAGDMEAGRGKQGASAGAPRELARRLRRVLAARHGLKVAIGPVQAHIAHAVTFRRIRLTVFEAKILAPSPPRSPGLCWLAPLRLRDRPVGALTRKAIGAILPAAAGRGSGRSAEPEARRDR